jgi:hypothetical protein
MTITNFNDLLNSFSIPKEDKNAVVTHTRIGDKTSNIYGGKYQIPASDWENFMKKYFDAVFLQGKKEFLTEKQLIENGPLLIDIDLKYDTTIKDKQHNEDYVIDLIMLYADKINELVALFGKFEIFVLEKSEVNILEDKTKDGLHIIFGIKMHKALQVMLREKIINEIENIWSDLPITNTWEDVFDFGVTKGCVNWQMYGSRKPNHLPYIIKYHYVLDYDTRDLKSNPIESFSTEKNILKLSARYSNWIEYTTKQNVIADFIGMKDKLEKKIPDILTPPPSPTPEDNQENDPYIDLLFNYLGNGYNEKKQKIISRPDRLSIGFTLKSNNYNKDLFIKYCALREGKGKDTAEETWESLNITEKTPMFNLEGIAKRVNPKKYKLWCKQKDDEIKKIGKEMLLLSVQQSKPEEKKSSSNCIVDDLHACDLLKEKYGESIRKCGDTWYVNMPDSNSWSRGEEYVKELIMKSRFTKKVGENEKPYSSNATGCSNIFKTICSYNSLFPINDNFIDNINLQTKGKLYFQDKYWDFNEKAWFPITDVIPLVYIKRNAPTFNFTQDEINNFKKSVLNMFANDDDVNLYLQAMARGLAGYVEDKKFYVMKGLRNSGKGILQEQAMASFGEYCCIYDVPMSKTNYKADASDRRWVLTSHAHIKRIGFTNEIANIAGKVDLPIDGNELKKVICSGGDTFNARGHYSDEIGVKFNATTFMSLNEIPKSNPADALENMILFEMPYKFVETAMLDEDTILYREKDSKLKDKIKTNTKWRDIYLYLIFEAFTDEPIEFSKMNETSQAEMLMVNKNSDSSNPVKLFNNAFIKDEKGWVSTADIKKVLEPAKLNDRKFGDFLKARGFIQKKGASISKLDEWGHELKDENGKVKKYQPQGYEGISLKQEIEDE